MVKKIKSESPVVEENRIVSILKKMEEKKLSGELQWMKGGGVVSDITATSSGILSLDIALGIGGYPQGRVIEVYGPNSAGKTSLTLHAIASVQKSGGISAFIDAEHCLCAGTLVYNTNENRYVPVELLVGHEFSVLSSTLSGDLVKRTATASDSGIREVYKIKTKFGNLISLTGNHKVLTQAGYKEVKALVAKEDCMFSPTFIPDFLEKNRELSLEEKDLYHLLGLHIGDGCHGSTQVANIDAEVIGFLKSIASRYGCYVRQDGPCSWCISQGHGQGRVGVSKEGLISLIEQGYIAGEIAEYLGCDVSTVRRYYKKYGLYDVYNFRKVASSVRNKKRERVKIVGDSCDIKVPYNPIYAFLSRFPCFFDGSKQRYFPEGLTCAQTCQVLSGIFMADGTAIDPDNKHRASISFSTSSFRLSLDIQAALSRFGIFSWKHISKKGGYDPSYIVHVEGVSNLSNFLKNIPIYSYKKDRILRAVASVDKRRSDIKTRSKKILGYLRGVEIISIEKSPVLQQTYDVSVQDEKFENQNFLANNVFIHNSLDVSYAKSLGVDVENLLINQPDSGEKALEMTLALSQELTKGDIVVVDSVAALVPQSELDGDMGQQFVGVQARLMSQAMRKLVGEVSRSGVIVYFTNQIRNKIGVIYGSNEEVTGGNALKFYASIRLDIRKRTAIKKGEDVIGNLTEIKVVKNKCAPPYKVAETEIRYGVGVPRALDVLLCGMNCGVVTKRGAWLDFNGECIGQGKDNAWDALKNNPELLNTLEKAVRAHYGI